MIDRFVFSANPLRLSWRHWRFVLAAIILAALALPWLWRTLEPFEPSAAYRVPYDFISDYWQVERWVERTSGPVLLGDSVVWGEYVAPGDSLPAALRRLAGGKGFDNLGLNGLCPAALAGFIPQCAGSLSDRPVLVVFNALWMSSEAADLRSPPSMEEWERGISINHAELMPQFFPGTPRYISPPMPDRSLPWTTWERWRDESRLLADRGRKLEDRLGNVLRRNADLLRLSKHLTCKVKAAANGREAPLDPLGPGLLASVPPPEDAPHSRPIAWYEAGLMESGMSFTWPRIDDSFQWRCFRSAVADLRSRGNRVLVVLAPFNPWIQSEDSRAGYRRMEAEILARLHEDGVAALAPPTLPREEYADGSHPLAAGYRRLAEGLWGSPTFQAWLTGQPPG